ncbi:DUF3310 domain-containing protein [Mammaliicoccus sciuri]|nr:DUF3310 domain-containing protein [Mammaliicoccus sciuri]
MLMEFKAGDRVRVLRLNGKKVNFFTTLKCTTLPAYYQTTDSSDSNYDGYNLRNPWNYYFGIDRYDYYTLATDEEDTEEPVIEYINKSIEEAKEYTERNTRNTVNIPTHYQADIDVIEFCRQHFTDEEFKGAMKFNLIKYPTRLGRKDDMVKELDKIIDYAQRYKEVLER